MLSAALDKANAQNAQLTEQLDQERGRNNDMLITPHKDTQPQQSLTAKQEENESNLVTRVGTMKSCSAFALVTFML
jgi:predicted amidophosphoribosyltransferase